MVNYLWDNLFNKDQEDKELSQLLKNSFLFSDLSLVELNFLKKLVHIRKYKPGEKVFVQGEVGVGMYMILSGSIDIQLESSTAEDSDKLYITRLKVGDFFGELALAESNHIRSASATSSENSTLVGFFKPELLEITERTPSAGVKILYRLCEVLAKRLKETSCKISDLKQQMDQLEDTTPNGVI